MKPMKDNGTLLCTVSYTALDKTRRDEEIFNFAHSAGE